jgi:EAL domain-containing protein (putative c-di-GMP-specific phosphodiesterase class I)
MPPHGRGTICSVAPHQACFVNIHPSTLAHNIENLDAFAAMLQHYEVAPRNVAVEIVEADLIDTTLLRAAVYSYNRHG